MAIELVNSSTYGTNVYSTSHTITYPSGIQEGDFGLIVVGLSGGTTPSTTPAGMELLSSFVPDSSWAGGYLYGGFIPVGSTSWYFGLSTTRKSAIAMVVLRGVGGIDALATHRETTLDNAGLYPAITTTVPDTFHVAMPTVASPYTTANLFGGSGWTQEAYVKGGTTTPIMFAGAWTQQFAGVGTHPAVSFSTNANTRKVAFRVALAPYVEPPFRAWGLPAY